MDCRVLSFNRSSGLFAATRITHHRISSYSHRSKLGNLSLAIVCDVYMTNSQHLLKILTWFSGSRVFCFFHALVLIKTEKGVW